MRKQLLTTCLALSIGTSALAQQPGPTVNTATSRADTVQAVHQMFRKHRTGGIIWTAIGSAFALRITSVAAGSGANGGFSGTTVGTIVGVGLFGGVPAGIGISKLARFSKAKEEQVVALYERSSILPPYIKKRLKPKYFTK